MTKKSLFFFKKFTILSISILFIGGGINQSDFEIRTQRTKEVKKSDNSNISGCKPISRSVNNYEKCLYNKKIKVKKIKFANI
jgi:hypothetical protein